MISEEQVQFKLSRCFSTDRCVPESSYLATSCGPCLSCLHQQRPAMHGHPQFFGHGPPSHVCPLERNISDLDCPHLCLLEQQQQSALELGFSILCSQPPIPTGSGD